MATLITVKSAMLYLRYRMTLGERDENGLRIPEYEHLTRVPDPTQLTEYLGSREVTEFKITIRLAGAGIVTDKGVKVEHPERQIVISGSDYGAVYEQYQLELRNLSDARTS